MFWYIWLQIVSLKFISKFLNIARIFQNVYVSVKQTDILRYVREDAGYRYQNKWNSRG